MSFLRNPWLVVGLLWPVALLNYLDRQMLSTARKSIRQDVPSIETDEDFGYLMAIFMWVYAALSPVGGYVGDRFGRRGTVVGSLLVWSAITWATGYATTFNEMFVLRGLMGVSEAFYIPAALALIADYHSGSTRTKAVALHQTGIYAGLALGGLGGYFADTSSWRDGFILCGVVGVGYAFVLAFTLRDHSALMSGSVGNSEAASHALATLAGNRSFWLLVGYFTLPAIAGWAINNWLPTFILDRYQISQRESGFIATGYVTLAKAVGAIGAGFLADALIRSTIRGRIWTSAAGVALCAPALLGIGFADSLNLTIACMVLFGLGWGMYDANNMPILCQVAKPEHRATGYGIMNLVSIGVGGLATIIFGRLRDQAVKERPDDVSSLFATAFVVSAALTLLSLVLVLTIRPQIETRTAATPDPKSSQ